MCTFSLLEIHSEFYVESKKDIACPMSPLQFRLITIRERIIRFGVCRRQDIPFRKAISDTVGPRGPEGVLYQSEVGGGLVWNKETQFVKLAVDEKRRDRGTRAPKPAESPINSRSFSFSISVLYIMFFCVGKFGKICIEFYYENPLYFINTLCIIFYTRGRR